jgi:hypothetical protein
VSLKYYCILRHVHIYVFRFSWRPLKKAETILYRRFLKTKEVKNCCHHSAHHCIFNMQVGEVAVPSCYHMLLFFSLLLLTPVLPNVQLWGEDTSSHGIPSDFQINLRNNYETYLFPQYFCHTCLHSKYLSRIYRKYHKSLHASWEKMWI